MKVGGVFGEKYNSLNGISLSRYKKFEDGFFHHF